MRRTRRSRLRARRASGHAGRSGRRDVQRSHRRVRGLRGRDLPEPIRLLSTADRCRRRSPSKFGAELGDTVNPMWLLRTLPNNVLGHVGIRHGSEGPERLHHQPQRQRNAGGRGGDGRPAARGSRSQRRGRARFADRAADDPLLPPSRTAGGGDDPVLRRPSGRQRVRRGRREPGPRDRGIGGRAAASPVLGEVLGQRQRFRRAGAVRHARGRGGAADAIGVALEDAGLRRARRRNDRRARQRDAPVGRIRSRGDSAGSSAPSRRP